MVGIGDGKTSFVVGLGDVKICNYGYIDRTGQYVVSLQFDDARDFKDGLAQVRIGDDKTGKWGYIDKTGKYVINPQFESADNFTEGLARVVSDGKVGYIAR